MTTGPATDQTVRDLVTGFCERHGIRNIRLTPMAGVTANYRVCNLEFEFVQSGQHAAYEANFKLQDADAGIGDMISEISANGDVKLVDGPQQALEPVAALKAFFSMVEKRLRKVSQEQSVQSVTFLGNSFLLHGTTTFTVVDDDEGRLTIEIHKGDDRQQARLLASSLLDGLYDGSIHLLEQETAQS